MTAAANPILLSEDLRGIYRRFYDSVYAITNPGVAAERRALLAEGARGYRHAFLEAGMVGERWLLGATARGLGACPVGAFYDDEAAALIGIDGRREWVLHFAALGVVAQ
jgi:nitroreductase